LAASTTYTATVSGAVDLAGTAMTSPVSWSFTSDTPPAVASTTPTAGATGVALGSTVTATFSEAVQPGTISFVLQDPSGNTVAASLAYNAATNTVTLTPDAPLAASTTYTATVSGAVDLAGTAMTSPISWSFTTSAGA
jgi:hypothetical protein